jgi:hypothetical protein
MVHIRMVICNLKQSKAGLHVVNNCREEQKLQHNNKLLFTGTEV